MRYGRVIESAIRETYRWVKFFGLSNEDKLDKKQVTPFGIDSVPIKDMIALYCETGIGGKGAVIGYLSPKALAEAGEIRLYSLDSNLQEKSYIWVKNNGDIEINGDTDNMVRYSALNTSLQSFMVDLKAELLLIQSAITVAGGAYVPTPTFNIDITSSKIDNVKTN